MSLGMEMWLAVQIDVSELYQTSVAAACKKDKGKRTACNIMKGYLLKAISSTIEHAHSAGRR